MDGDKLADVCRSMLLAEWESIHRRVTWLAILQGFLFAAVGSAWKAPDSKFLLIIVELLGLAISILVLISFIGPIRSVLVIQEYWVKTKPDDYKGLGAYGWFPEKPRSNWFNPENWIPLCFALAWAVLFCYTAVK